MGSFTVHELITNNTACGLGDLKQLPVTGMEFLPRRVRGGRRRG
jgi:copper transport protein